VILVLDSSGPLLTAALYRGALEAAAAAGERQGPGSDIGAVVAELLAEAGAGADAVERIICGAGPGSFIGTRTAISCANGLSAAGRAELYAAPSLPALLPPDALARERPALALRDARRGQWYCWQRGPDGESTAAYSFADLQQVIASLPAAPVSVEAAPEGADRKSHAAQAELLAVLTGRDVRLVSGPQAASLLQLAEGTQPQPYIEPVYLRSFL
jgi:tRNA threonylcarbamoyl adenosine modification protein YeaZ